jgi:hypothetical protein
MQRAEREKIRKRNCQGEMVYRNAKDQFYPIVEPKHFVRSAYPWELESHLPKITKEFFRCKGSSQNPPILTMQGDKPIPKMDCEGGLRHGLSIVHGQEGVYPILIDLLNYVQKKTGKRVIITSGHRCAIHHAYIEDPIPSKNRKGAEVDFYVQGMEDAPEEIAAVLMHYFKEKETYQNMPEYQTFSRAAVASLKTEGFVNKEVSIQIYTPHERRNFDNRHPYPYLSIQVRFDPEENTRIY